jgi:S-adenosylmethionine:tRNA ribosyltransferase-isomerase
MVNKHYKYTINDYDYDITDDRIAQYPLDKRTDSRMLVLDAEHEAPIDSQFCQLKTFLKPNDLLVFNDTKVVPARLYGRKETGGKIEALIERFLPDQRVMAHVKASKAPKAGQMLFFQEGAIEVEVLSRHDDLFELQFPKQINIFDWLQQYGHIPLPPYIQRSAERGDHNRYQTVFARHKGAVAAPTAGLHFDEKMIQSLREAGVNMAYLTLHVGAGTFQPVRGDDLDAHQMHSEHIEVLPEVCEAVAACRRQGGRVIAVGTTVCRALETAAQSGELKPYSGDTDIFIKEGFTFNCIDGLITNFHLPKSTLLVLVSVFMGYESIKNAYQFALMHQYRFFSYGDLMLMIR